MTQPDPQGAREVLARHTPGTVPGINRCDGCWESWPCDAVLMARRADALEGALRLHNQTPTGKVRTCLPGCIACALLRPSENSYLIDQDFDE